MLDTEIFTGLVEKSFECFMTVFTECNIEKRTELYRVVRDFVRNAVLKAEKRVFKLILYSNVTEDIFFSQIQTTDSNKNFKSFFN
jgi:hypothetical protein